MKTEKSIYIWFQRCQHDPSNLRPCCRRRSRKCTPVCDQVRWNVNEWNKFLNTSSLVSFYVSKIITKLASLEMRALLFTKSPPGPRFLPKVFLPPPHLPLLRAQVIKLTQGLSQLFLDCKMKSSRIFIFISGLTGRSPSSSQTAARWKRLQLLARWKTLTLAMKIVLMQCASGWEARDSYCVACPPGMYRHQVMIVIISCHPLYVPKLYSLSVSGSTLSALPKRNILREVRDSFY